MPAYPQVAVALVERSFEDGLVDVLEVDALLEEMLARPAWQRDAACSEHSVATFFPARGQSPAPARIVCARCPVLGECRSWALEQGPELQGVWAGLSEQQRRRALNGGPVPALVVASSLAAQAARAESTLATKELATGTCAACQQPGVLSRSPVGVMHDGCLSWWKQARKPTGEAFEAWAAERRAELAKAG